MDTDAHVRAMTLVAELRAAGSETNRAGMARFGINVEHACGVTVAFVRTIARRHRRDAQLARALWQTGLHEARILACLVHAPAEVTDEEIEAMVHDIDSWDLCDQFTNNLARHLPRARDKARSWLAAEAPFVKRAGLSLVASLAVHDKTSPRAVFEADAQAVAAVACDDRQPVKKGISWALRQIGKRDEPLRLFVKETVEALLASGDHRARFAARDVLRELSRPDVLKKTASKSVC